jgi:two-component system, chemotaxis family, CheB/CheR fusion protein
MSPSQSDDSPPMASPPDAPLAAGAAGVRPSDDASSAPEEAPPVCRVHFPVVGIGASAGGLEALEGIMRRLGAGGPAVVVVQHLAPGHVSMLADILGRATSLRVVSVEHGMRLAPGTVYVAPPSVELGLVGEELHVGPTDGKRPPHAIDAFMRSLASVAGPMAIGVILSGSGSDGTLGLKAIKGEGGITFAQEPSTAAQPSMPQSAIDVGCADFVLAPAEIGDELMRLGAHPYTAKAAASAKAIDGDAMGKIFALLRAAHGVDFASYKQSTVGRRIERRMTLRKAEDVGDYVSLLTSDPTELHDLYGDLLIGVTSFFRDAEPFEALKATVFPRIFEGRSVHAPVRVWVAGCAGGEEAYSMAIAMLEFLGDRAARYKIQIFGTDIDESALSRARAAVYPSTIQLDVSQDRLRRFLATTDKGYQLHRQVRDLVVFARHNLGRDPPFSRLDLVTCRNVLIYMQPPLQKKVLRIFHYALNADGYLLLGTSESVGETSDLFSLVDRKVKIYVRKNVRAASAVEFSLGVRGSNDEHGVPPARDHRPMFGVAQIADRTVIEKYAPPGVIVDERLEIVQFRGKTGPYLEPAPGVATLNLLKLVRPELLVALRAIVQKALADGISVSSPPVPLWSDDVPRSVSLDVTPLPDGESRRCLLVLFKEVQARPSTAAPSVPTAATGQAARIAELDRELVASKEYLQSTIEELESSNEELQSSNEELQSSNEELQSTNEELETSKEELQSTNEELGTVNEELSNRMAQLSIVNDDLQNVLLNGSSAIVIVGADLRIRRFSSSAERLFSLVPSDVGRPVAYLRNVISARDITSVAQEAISSVLPHEQRVRCIDGSWLTMKMVPYVTADHMIRGAVIEFVKTIAPGEQTEPEAVPPFAQRVLSAVSLPMMLVDTQLRLLWANRALLERFEISPAALGRPVAEAWGSPSEPPEFWLFLGELAAGRPGRDVLVEHPFGRSAERPVRVSGKVVVGPGDHVAQAMVLMQDVSSG